MLQLWSNTVVTLTVAARSTHRGAARFCWWPHAPSSGETRCCVHSDLLGSAEEVSPGFSCMAGQLEKDCCASNLTSDPMPMVHVTRAGTQLLRS